MNAKNSSTIVVLFLIVVVVIVIVISGYFDSYRCDQFNVDIYPTALTTGEKTISLIGYGTAGTEDDDLTIIDMLTYTVQDKYLARAQYQAIANVFNVEKPYNNMALSDDTFLSYLKEIFASYNLDFPEDTSSSYITTPESLLAAAKLGVSTEQNSIAMYKKFLTRDLPSDVYNLFLILKKNSEKHLKVFEQLEKDLS